LEEKMTTAHSIVKVSIRVALGVVALSISPVIVGALSILLANALGCDFLAGTSTTVLCEPQAVRDTLEFGTMLTWYAFYTIPVGFIAFVLFLVLLVIRLLVRR
jgi:hypothetical protein